MWPCHECPTPPIVGRQIALLDQLAAIPEEKIWLAKQKSAAPAALSGSTCDMLEDVQEAAGHSDPSTTKLYDRRGYNPEKAASFFATY